MNFYIVAKNLLADVAGALAEFFTEAERHLRSCGDCGRSVFYGKGCVDGGD